MPPISRTSYEADLFLDRLAREQATFLASMSDSIRQLRPVDHALADFAADVMRMVQQFVDAGRGVVRRRAETLHETAALRAEAERKSADLVDQAAQTVVGPCAPAELAAVREDCRNWLGAADVEEVPEPVGDVSVVSARRELAAMLDRWWAVEQRFARQAIEVAERHRDATVERVREGVVRTLEHGEVDAADSAEPGDVDAAGHDEPGAVDGNGSDEDGAGDPVESDADADVSDGTIAAEDGGVERAESSGAVDAAAGGARGTAGGPLPAALLDDLDRPEEVALDEVLASMVDSLGPDDERADEPLIDLTDDTFERFWSGMAITLPTRPLDAETA